MVIGGITSAAQAAVNAKLANALSQGNVLRQNAGIMASTRHKQSANLDYLNQRKNDVSSDVSAMQAKKSSGSSAKVTVSYTRSMTKHSTGILEEKLESLKSDLSGFQTNLQEMLLDEVERELAAAEAAAAAAIAAEAVPVNLFVDDNGIELTGEALIAAQVEAEIAAQAEIDLILAESIDLSELQAVTETELGIEIEEIETEITTEIDEMETQFLAQMKADIEGEIARIESEISGIESQLSLAEAGVPVMAVEYMSATTDTLMYNEDINFGSSELVDLRTDIRHSETKIYNIDNALDITNPAIITNKLLQQQFLSDINEFVDPVAEDISSNNDTSESPEFLTLVA